MSAREVGEVEIAVIFGDGEDVYLDDAGDIAPNVVMDVDDERVSPSKAQRYQKPKSKSSEKSKKRAVQQVSLMWAQDLRRRDRANARGLYEKVLRLMLWGYMKGERQTV
jgi:hypothetical protein